MDPFTAILSAIFSIFNPGTAGAAAATAASASLAALKFLGSLLINAALSGGKVPRLSDLKIQVSGHGNTIPRVYGEEVRLAGNVIDKSDLIAVKHKKGEMLGIGGVKYYTYDAHVAVLLCEGPQPVGSLRRIYADGKVFFDRDATDATAGVVTAEGGTRWSRTNKTHKHADTITFYPGTSTQDTDPTLQALDHNVGEDYPAYRHSCYVVIKRLTCSDFGNRVPNLEFIIEPDVPRLGDIVEDIAAFADVTVRANRLNDVTVRGFVVAQDGSCWDAISPLAGTFSFDLIANAAAFDAVKRGRYMRTIIPAEDLDARQVGGAPSSTKDVARPDGLRFPDEVTVKYFDIERDYQIGSQRAKRNAGYSANKESVEVAIALTASEARDVAQKALYEAQAVSKTNKFRASKRYRWLKAGDVVGLTIGGNVEPWRLLTVTESPNGVIEFEACYEDPFLYQGGLTSSAGDFPVNELELPGDTIFQPIDAAIVRDSHDDTGFYGTFAGTGVGWNGTEVNRALGVGSPLTFEVIGNAGVEAVIGDCATTLPDGPTNVWDEVSTVTVELIDPDGSLTDATAEEVETLGANLAWIGAPDGQDGEYLHFRTATPGGSPTQWVLSGLLRGRKGTEHAVAGHGSGERFVLMNDADAMYRLDFGAVDWNQARTYRSDSLPDDDNGLQVEFTNTGEGKRPLSPVHLEGVRNDDNDDILIQWVRRTRYQTGDIAAPVPLGEETEAYEIDIYDDNSPPAVVRTLTASAPSVNYTSAMQTEDGKTPGDPVMCDVCQMSTTRGRGRAASGVV